MGRGILGEILLLVLIVFNWGFICIGVGIGAFKLGTIKFSQV